MFHESAIIPSLYTSADQNAIDRWMQSAPVYPGWDDLDDSCRVAEIALFSVRGKLPQGMPVNGQERTSLDRASWTCPVPMRNKILFPLHLCEVGRYDAQETTSSPESYYVTFLPGYNIYVITVSLASSAAYGCLDFAVDFFQTADDPARIASHASLVLKAWWKYQQKELHKPCWQEILQSGLIEEDSALLTGEALWANVENYEAVLV